MDQTQIILTIALTLSTIFMIIIGVQLIFLLRDIRKITKKIINITDILEKFGFSLEHGFSEITGFLAGLKTILKIAEVIKKKNGKEK
jgi:hypothetical protein